MIAVGMAILLVIGLAIPATRPSGNKVEDAEHPPTLDVSWQDTVHIIRKSSGQRIPGKNY